MIHVDSAPEPIDVFDRRLESYSQQFNTIETAADIISCGNSPLYYQGKVQEFSRVQDLLQKDLYILSRFQPLEVLSSINTDQYNGRALITFEFGQCSTGFCLQDTVTKSAIFVGLIKDRMLYNQGLFSTIGLGVGFGTSRDEAFQSAENFCFPLSISNDLEAYNRFLINSVAQMLSHRAARQNLGVVPIPQSLRRQNQANPHRVVNQPLPQRQNIAANQPAKPIKPSPVPQSAAPIQPAASAQPIPATPHAPIQQSNIPTHQGLPIQDDRMQRAAAAHANEQQQVGQYLKGPIGLPPSINAIDNRIRAERLDPMQRLERLNNPLGLGRSGLGGGGLGGGRLGR